MVALRRRWRGAVELDADLVRRASDDPTRVRALAYPALVGEPVLGDRVLLNLAAIGLGTGGYAQVVALPERLPADGARPADRVLPADRGAAGDRGAGDVVKARYTPMQVCLPGADQRWPGDPDGLGGLPVVIADLHSALPAVLAGVLADRPAARVGYVMTDGGALPAWFSQTVAALADRLAGVVTAGQCFGGDLEAVNVHSGLLAARHALGAEVCVVAPGPGSLGTATRWGFSGTAAGDAVNAVACLGGRPVGVLRISGADPRPRHRGVSHHSLTAYGRVALAPADLVVPMGLPPELAAEVDAAVAILPERHRVVRVDPAGLDAALRALPVRLSTMDRGLDADPGYFLAAAAAGRHAAALLRLPYPFPSI